MSRAQDPDETFETDEPETERRGLVSVAHVVFVIVAALLVFGFVTASKEGEARRRCSATCLLKPTYAGYERTAPDFHLKDTKGAEVSLSSFRGKVVVLNFWTQTCGPCMEEMPEIAELAHIVRPMKDVAVLTVSTDEDAAGAENVIRSVLRAEPPFPILMDPEAKIVAGKYGTKLYPETWIIDKNGVIRARFDGAREWSNAAVVELLEQLRRGGHCGVEAREGKFVKDAKVCESIAGG